MGCLWLIEREKNGATLSVGIWQRVKHKSKRDECN